MAAWNPDSDPAFTVKMRHVHVTVAAEVASTPVGALPAPHRPEGAISVVAAHLARALPDLLDSLRRDQTMRRLFGPVAQGEEGYLIACREFQLLCAASTRIVFRTLPADRAAIADAHYRKAFSSKMIRTFNPGLPTVEMVDVRFQHYLGVLQSAVGSNSPVPWAWLVLSYLTGLHSEVNRVPLMEHLTATLLAWVLAQATTLRKRGVGPAVVL